MSSKFPGAGLVPLVLLATACGGSDAVTPPPPPPPPPAVASVTVNPASPELVPTATVQLTAKVADGAGNELSGRTVAWSSSDQAVATVTSTGLATAAGVGTATITATSEGKSGTASISVRDGGIVSASGGQVSAASGKVTIQVPAQALSVPTAITVTPVTSPPADPNLVAGTAYEFGPAGTQFNQPVTLKIQYDAASVTAAAVPSLFRIHRWTGTAWQPLVGSTTDPLTRTVTGQTSSFSIYAVVEIPVPIASIGLSAARLDLGIGETAHLVATPKDADGHPLAGRAIAWSSSNPDVATVSADGLVTAATVGATTIRAAAEGVTAEIPVAVTAVSPELIEERILSQEGLAIALASTVLQSQLRIVLATGDGPDADPVLCEALEGGGSYQTLPIGARGPTKVEVYFDDACTRPYITADVTLSPNNTAGTTTVHGVNVYHGPTGTLLGTLTVDETLVVPNQGSVLAHGLGVFVPANGAVPVQLGLECTVDLKGNGGIPCAGGVAQDFSSIGKALGSVTPLTLAQVGQTSALTFQGGGSLQVGPIGSLTLTAPTPTTMVIEGGTVFGTDQASGSAASFSLFPPTPTGWSVVDQGHDRKFQIDVVSNTIRNLVAHLTEISTGRILATVTLDQSGTGTITYSDGSTQPVTNWLLAN